ncbi:MAG: YciI family protein [Solidesulfovibrio sp. DCME]|uniref:YciI family protein n=1 Tax=Solidesulfovibrio sp. DCME TaxID=3447380 RepID=UPI003D14EAD8
MFLVLLHYVKPVAAVDALLEEHIRFLEGHYAQGTFVLSGRQVPRTGGLILARADSREALMAVLAGDPFWREGAARYEVVEFVPSKAAPELACLLS